MEKVLFRVKDWHENEEGEAGGGGGVQSQESFKKANRYQFACVSG